MSEENQAAKPEVKQLIDLLQYQDSSIVSRVLLKNKGGTVTLFAFDEDEGLSEHTAPFDALVVVLDGEANIQSPANISLFMPERPSRFRRTGLTR